MSNRQGAPTHDPIGDLLDRITRMQDEIQALGAAGELMNIAPLRLVVTVSDPGPPPRYLVEIVNPASGGRVTLADFL